MAAIGDFRYQTITFDDIFGRLQQHGQKFWKVDHFAPHPLWADRILIIGKTFGRDDFIVKADGHIVYGDYFSGVVVETTGTTHKVGEYSTNWKKDSFDKVDDPTQEPDLSCLWEKEEGFTIKSEAGWIRWKLDKVGQDHHNNSNEYVISCEREGKDKLLFLVKGERPDRQIKGLIKDSFKDLTDWSKHPNLIQDGKVQMKACYCEWKRHPLFCRCG